MCLFFVTLSVLHISSFVQLAYPTNIHVNIRNLRKHWDQFKVMVYRILSRIDAFVLTESNMSESLRDFFQLPGYN